MSGALMLVPILFLQQNTPVHGPSIGFKLQCKSFVLFFKNMANAKIKFGTSGWRGVIADDFTFERVRTVVQAIADHHRRV
jgi:hypothetical protein